VPTGVRNNKITTRAMNRREFRYKFVIDVEEEYVNFCYTVKLGGCQSVKFSRDFGV